VLDPIPPLLTSEELRFKKRGNPCSDYCFIHLDLSKDSDAVSGLVFESNLGPVCTIYSILQEDVHWEIAADFKTLDGVLQFAPDSLPCDLAVIMHVKCQDVRSILRIALHTNLLIRSLYIAGVFSPIQ
jgi:hypothetical protein